MTAVFQAAGYDVVGLDTFYFAECTLEPDYIKVAEIRKDIRDVTVADLEGIDVICHMAALSNDPLGDLDASLTYDINHSASTKLAILAKQAGVSRFLYASSCSMYGASSANEILTEESPLNPLTPYAISKIRTEDDLRKLADDHFSPVYMRNATVYGVSPRLRADIVLNNLTAWAYTTGKIRIMSDGTPWRPLVHVRDVCAAFVAVAGAKRDAIHNQAFNVGQNNENYQVRDLAEIVRQTVPNCTVEYGKESVSDPRNYRVDFSKIKQIVDTFKPEWNAQRGAAELYKAYMAAGLTFDDFQGRRYVRLKQIKHLLDTELLNADLRWN